MTSPNPVPPATGKLGVLTPGMGAVATTFYAGVLAARKGYAQPFGSLTQMGHIRLGKRTDDRNPRINEFVPLAGLEDLEFGGWDAFSDDAYTAAMKAGVLDARHLEGIGEELRAIVPMKAVFSPKWVKNLPGVDHVKDEGTHMDHAEALMEDIDRFRSEKQVDRLVAVWCGSTEAYEDPAPVHMDLDTFEAGLKDNDPRITPSQVYAYALLKMGVPFANGAPNLTVDIPAMEHLAIQQGVPIAGKDFKTGQTLMKTIVAPGLRARMLGINGWFSTNILGNRDGEVLDDPESFRSKEVSKLGVLETILQPDLHPDLYGDLHHVVRINYYPPKGTTRRVGPHRHLRVAGLQDADRSTSSVGLDPGRTDRPRPRPVHGSGSGPEVGIRVAVVLLQSPHTAAGLNPEHDLFVRPQAPQQPAPHDGRGLITHLGTGITDEEP